MSVDEPCQCCGTTLETVYRLDNDDRLCDACSIRLACERRDLKRNLRLKYPIIRFFQLNERT